MREMEMTGARIIVETLIEQGVDTVFGYPGGSVLPLYDELYRQSGRIRHITTCHEQAAAHAADGYARASGKTGVCIATSGPGATNLVTGIANAFLDSTPMVAITGNVATALLGRDSFQEVDIAGIAIPITKHSFIVKNIGDLAKTLREAFAIANSGRPGPVLVDVPRDVQAATAAFQAMPAFVKRCPDLPADAVFAEAARLIKDARRPFIYCGGGVVSADAADELAAFCERIGAPVGASMMGLSAMPHDHPRFLGMVGMHGRYAATRALYESDLLIAVGVRFSDRATGNKTEFSHGRRVIQIDIDPAEMSKNIPAHACLTGDVKTVLARLMHDVCEKRHPAWDEAVERMKADPANSLEMGNARLTPQHIIEGACARMGSGVVATDVGQHQMWATQYYRFSRPRTFITSGGLGTMGFGMGAAMGACLANGGARTLLLTSDGSFHMNMNELATAVSYGLPLLVLVLNNEVLGMVRQWQTLFYGKRYAQTDLGRKTDYVQLARAFGALGLRATTRTAYAAALDEAFAHGGPVVIDCHIGKDEQVLPMIPPGMGINNIILR
jgi:acetolactate synthase-1/2/3 large subunit